MTDVVTLKQLCTELKVEPRDARARLRLAAKDPKKHSELAKGHNPRQPWQWAKGSAGERQARVVVAAKAQ